MAAPVPLYGAGDLTTAPVTSSATLVGNKPANVADGDLLVAVLMSRNSSGTWDTVPAGWTETPSQNTSGTFGIFTKPIPSAAGEAATSYSWHTTGGSARGAVAIFRVTGANLNKPVDATGTPVTSGTSSIAAPSVTAVWDETLLLGIYTSHLGTSSQPVVTAPSGMTEITGIPIPNSSTTPTAHSYLEVCHQTLTAAGATGSRTAAVSPAGTAAAGMLLTLQPVPTGTATLTAAQTLTSAATLVAVAAPTTLSAADSLVADGQAPAAATAALDQPSEITTTAHQTHTASATLLAGTTLAATAGYGVVNQLSGGVWQPVTLYELVAGSWVQS